MAGLAGALGAAGLAGATGPTGPTGATGAAGANGATGFGLSQYGYVYNLLAQVVPVNADVLFDTNGILTPGITHAPGTSQIVVTVPGDYEVTFNVTAVEPNQFTLLLNGNAIAGATYGTGAGTQKNVGQVIVAIPSGGILTLRNHTSASAVTLQTLAGGTEINVNASILLKKLN
ncbi:BclA C-terminal domain-containing protein [Paenibacillus sacheonensis]|uniref:BclA C-terminal domain-containing protein n=1 Tax=Paenibacillus sacheonensis TaxID=742054 RepID=UPI001EF7DF10|nr:collagen-like protein [Paenibacillus sacheonensis]MBM7565771.1 hypothetical protein [Paenibacillus sacheonensis]